MTEKDLAEDYRIVLHEAKSMGCNEIKALYNIPLKNMEMIVQALEKQIPKKPRFYTHNYYCSVCDNLVGNNEFEWRRFKYCDTCGQRLDWSDEE